jgi:hypothetical protein
MRDTMDIAKSMFTLDVILSIPHFEPHHALIFMQLTLAQAHIPDMMAHGGVVTKKQVSVRSNMIAHNRLFFSAILNRNAGGGRSEAEGNGSG